MICFDKDNVRFNYRVAGIALQDDRVLLNHLQGADYWFLPGGRVELMETSIDALRREVQEELAEDVYVDRLLWVVESFFEDSKRNFHEIAFYYLISFPESSPIYEKRHPFEGVEGHSRLFFEWQPLNSLATMTIYPPFLTHQLHSLPEFPIQILDTNRT